jgi:hypothetical protein
MTTPRNLVTGTVAVLAIFLGGCFCSAGPGQSEASLYLTDSTTGSPIAGATFTEAGNPVNASCGETDAHHSERCVSETLILGPGAHTIDIAAPGYAPSSVMVDTTKSDAVHLAVELTPSR